MRFFSLLLCLLLSNYVQAQYKEIERTAVNEVIVVHCFKDKQLSVSVDTGNLLHLNAKRQIGYIDFKTELEIEDVIGAFEAVGYTLVNLCRPQKENDSITTIAFRKSKRKR